MQRNQNQNSTPDITVATITTADTSGTITPNKQTMQGQAE